MQPVNKVALPQAGKVPAAAVRLKPVSVKGEKTVRDVAVKNNEVTPDALA